ncbi:hypothetical protein PAECIP111892_00548 [Paenibacillus auburnensis]|uniref:Uncharacterized protein n=2 Tax=Paenibacillus auburnensis TaxID=2905649 RepID=A0ABN8FWD3_9BACL|nr:hypothetical protein PAECIP111892_00548 [Paenibacillus auburnensis]
MLSWDIAGFMFFSTIETVSLYYLIMTLFRFKWRAYLWPAMFIILINNLQSYLLRNELDLANISPLITIMVFIFFFAAVVRMPFVFSVIATISGYVIFAVIQSALVLLMFGSLSQVENHTINGYILQTASAAVVFAVFWFAYRKGKGFTFDMEKLRFKLEDIVLTVLIIIFLIGISVLLVYKNLWIDIAFFIVMSAFLLYYSTKKEREDA